MLTLHLFISIHLGLLPFPAIDLQSTVWKTLAGLLRSPATSHSQKDQGGKEDQGRSRSHLPWSPATSQIEAERSRKEGRSRTIKEDPARSRSLSVKSTPNGTLPSCYIYSVTSAVLGLELLDPVNLGFSLLSGSAFSRYFSLSRKTTSGRSRITSMWS